MNKTRYERIKQVLKDFLGNKYYQDISNVFDDIIIRAFDEMEERQDLDISEIVTDAINDSLIYYDDQWIVMRYYFIDPKEANFYDMIENLEDDCITIIQEVLYREEVK